MTQGAQHNAVSLSLHSKMPRCWWRPLSPCCVCYPARLPACAPTHPPLQLTININVAGKDTYATVDYPPPGYDTRYLTGWGPDADNAPYDTDNTPQEPTDQQPYTYRGGQQKLFGGKRRGEEPTHIPTTVTSRRPGTPTLGHCLALNLRL